MLKLQKLLHWFVLVFSVVAGVAACTSHGGSTRPGGMQQPVDANLLTVNGGYLFAEHCATCHGENGEGVTPSIEYSPQSVPDLRYISARHNGRFPDVRVREIIDGRQMLEAHHRRMMPRWADELQRLEGGNETARRRAAQKIDALVDYVRSIQLNE